MVPKILQARSDIRVGNYTACSALALLVYDSALTFPSEVKLVWRGRFGFGVAGYLIARYCAIVLLGLGLYPLIQRDYFTTEKDTRLIMKLGTAVPLSQCTQLRYAQNSINAFYILGLHGLPLLRAYAISNGQRWVRILLCGIFGIFLLSQLAKIALASCQWFEHLVHPMNVAVSTLAIFSDATIVLVTLYHTWNRHKLNRQLYSRGRQSLSDLMLRQGLIHFMIIFTWALKISATEMLVRSTISDVDLRYEIAISTSLVCRFFLQLREHSMHYDSKISKQQQTTSLDFGTPLPLRLENSIMEEFSDPDIQRMPHDGV